MSPFILLSVFSKQTQDDSGVSPVIGVILMVAVTVALVALVTVTVFDLGGDVGESPDAVVQLEQDTDDSQIDATVLRNENVESFELNNANVDTDAGDEDLSASSGSTQSIDALDGETVQVIATLPDGSTEVLTSTEYEG